jgi:hypothetical protein
MEVVVAPPPQYHHTMPTGSFDLKAWARIGAERRLEEIREERQRIHAAFPDLRRGRTYRATNERQADSSSPSTTRIHKRKRRTMSAEARAKIAAAQRRRWAKYRRENRENR